MNCVQLMYCSLHASVMKDAIVTSVHCKCKIARSMRVLQVKTALADTTGNRLVSAAQTCFQDNDLGGVVKLLLPHLGLVFATSDDHALETAFIVLIQIIVRVSDSDEGAAITLSDQLMDFLASSKQEKPLNRLTAMLELFNSWPSPQYQHALLLRILDYACEAKLSQLAASMHNRADLWQRAWALDEGRAMELFERIARVLDMHPSPLLKKEAFSLQTRVLLACPSGDKQRINALKATARSAALAFIGNPAQFSCDVFQTAPVQALKGDKEHGEIFALLEMLLQGKLADYDSKRFAGLLSQAQTTEAELLDKVCIHHASAKSDGRMHQSIVATADLNVMLNVMLLALNRCHSCR